MYGLTHFNRQLVIAVCVHVYAHLFCCQFNLMFIGYVCFQPSCIPRSAYVCVSIYNI